MLDHLEIILDSISDAFIALDKQWCFTYVNKQAEELLGKKRELLLGKNYNDQFSEVWTPASYTHFRKAMETGQAVCFEEYYQPLGLWMEVRCHPYESGLSVYFRDISCSKKAQRFREAYREIQQAITSTLDFDEVLRRVAVEAVIAMNCESSLIILRNDNICTISYIYGLPEEYLGLSFFTEDLPVVEQVLSTGQTEVFTNGCRCRREHPVFKSPAKRSLATPLKVKEEIVGVLVLNHHSVTEFSAAEIDFAGLIAGTVAIALTNAQLYTTMKAANRNLKDERQRLRAVLAALPVGVCIADAEGRLEEINEITNTILGGRMPMVQGIAEYGKVQAWYAETGKPVQPHDWAMAKALTLGVTTVGDMLDIRRMDGQKVTVVNSGAPIRNSSGDIIGGVVVLQDITRMRKLEQEVRRLTEGKLQASQERFYLAFNANPCLMIIQQLDGKMLEVNISFEHLTGWKSEEVIGKTTVELGICTVEESERIHNLFLQQGYVHNEETYYTDRSGRVRQGLISTENLCMGEEDQVLMIVTDITERRQWEKDLARLDRLNLVGQMAAGFGHEIRNPMTAARGFLQHLERKTEIAQHKAYLNLAIEELDRANAIISEFLSLARNKAIRPRPTNLNHLVETMAAFLQANALLSNQTVRMEPGQIPALMLDEKEIRQLILNLGRNSLEAMSDGGVLAISTFVEDQEVVLAVADQGPGIDRQIIDKLGTPFVTTKDNGTGLGLPVCYSIVERHGGKIDVVTGPAGTTFYIRFPVNKLT